MENPVCWRFCVIPYYLAVSLGFFSCRDVQNVDNSANEIRVNQQQLEVKRTSYRFYSSAEEHGMPQPVPYH